MLIVTFINLYSHEIWTPQQIETAFSNLIKSEAVYKSFLELKKSKFDHLKPMEMKWLEKDVTASFNSQGIEGGYHGGRIYFDQKANVLYISCVGSKDIDDWIKTNLDCFFEQVILKNPHTKEDIENCFMHKGFKKRGEETFKISIKDALEKFLINEKTLIIFSAHSLWAGVMPMLIVKIYEKYPFLKFKFASFSQPHVMCPDFAKYFEKIVEKENHLRFFNHNAFYNDPIVNLGPLSLTRKTMHMPGNPCPIFLDTCCGGLHYLESFNLPTILRSCRIHIRNFKGI